MGFDPTISSVKAGIYHANIQVYGVEWAGEETGPIPVTIRARKAGDEGWVKQVGVYVDRNGNIIDAPTIAVENARPGVQYEVNAVYSLGSGPGLSAIVVAPYYLMGNYYLVSNAANTVCGAEPVFLYSKEAFGQGVTMYYDSALTTPITEGYISRKSYGPIYYVNSGVVGAVTSWGCFSTISGKFALGATASICNIGFQVLFTNAPDLNNLVGYEMFYDRAMTEQVLGFHYLLSASNGVLYTIDDIESSVVLGVAGECEDYFNLFVKNNSADRVIEMVSVGDQVYNDDIPPVNEITATHAGFNTGITIKLSGGGGCDSCSVSELKLLKGSVSQQIMKVKDGIYKLNPVTFLPSDEVTIELNNVPIT